MNLTSTPAALTCSECGESVSEAAYLPALERDGEYEPMAEAAVCNTCGFNEVGYAGCAPELGDLVDPQPDTVLLYVELTDSGLDILSVKE